MTPSYQASKVCGNIADLQPDSPDNPLLILLRHTDPQPMFSPSSSVRGSLGRDGEAGRGSRDTGSGQPVPTTQSYLGHGRVCTGQG